LLFFCPFQFAFTRTKRFRPPVCNSHKSFPPARTALLSSSEQPRWRDALDRDLPGRVSDGNAWVATHCLPFHDAGDGS
jgi:hypothetical protein